MDFGTLALVVPLLAGIVLCAFMVIFLLRKKYIACYKLAVILFSALFIWITLYTVEILSSSLSVKILLSKFEYIGITVVPVSFFLLVLYLSGYTSWTHIRKNFFMFIIPAITIVIVFTNEMHHLMWNSMILGPDGRFLYLEYGAFFWIFAGFSYIFIIMSYIVLIRTIIGRIRIFKLQAISVIIALSISWVSNLLYILKLLPWENLDITPLMLIMSSLILVYSFKFFKTGDVIPVKFKPVIDNERDIVIVLDSRDRLVSINIPGEKLLNVSGKDIIGKKIENIWSDYRELRSNGETAIFKMDSSELIFDIQINPIKAGNNLISYSIITLRDITQKVNSERALRQSEEKFRKIFENSIDGIYQSTPDGTYIDVNRALIKMLGYSSKKELMAKNIIKDIYYSKKDRPSPRERNKSFITRLKKKDGSVIWVEISSNVNLEDGKPKIFEGIVRDIDNRIKAEEKIRYLSSHDYLTGLYNRYFFEEELNRLDGSRLYPVSLVIIDINGFKLINDTFGNNKGDEILINTATILKNCFRKEDILARYGGDEFIVLLPSTKREVAEKIIKRVNEAFESNFYKKYITSLSIGIATKDSDKLNMGELVKMAENNMYKHKLIEKQSSHSSIITTLQKSLEERNYETHEHMDRMKDLSLKLGRMLKFSEEKLDEISLLALLHDIGKIAIPDNIILKPGKLTVKEYDLMKKHSEIGFRIASSNPDLATIAKGILYHHERWDGNGYPAGLKWKEIPQTARIVAIVDTYDAMTNNRPYRKAHSIEYAKKEIINSSGTQFDPALVKEFIRLISNKNKSIHKIAF